MKKISSVIYANVPNPAALPEILAGLEEEGVPGEVVILAANEADPLEMAKAASKESVFGCGIGLSNGKAALFADGAVVARPGTLSPRAVGKNAALFIKKERFELDEDIHEAGRRGQDHAV